MGRTVDIHTSVVLFVGCREILAPAPAAPPSPPSFLTLLFTVVFPTFFSSLLSRSLARSGFALPQIRFPRGNTDVTGGAQPFPTVELLELSGSGCVRHGTALFPHRDHPCWQYLATYTQSIHTNKTSETFCVKG